MEITLKKAAPETPEAAPKKQDPDKFLTLLKNNRYVLLSFGGAIVVFLLICIAYRMIPFGDVTILRMDLYHQYGPLLAELYDRITHGGSLAYSWQTGGGGNFLGNFFNYLSSPISILVILLLGHKNMPVAIGVIIMLKAAFSAAFFTYYLKKSPQFRKHNPITAGFGLLYAFSGYFVAYYWNIMWVDGMMLLPLIVLGVEYIAEGKKPLLYCLSLALLLVSSYYMAYMTAIFLVLYFFAYYFGHHSIRDTLGDVRVDQNGKTSLFETLRKNRFVVAFTSCVGYAAIAGLLSAFALLPTYYALKTCSATSGTFPEEFETYFSFFDFLSNHFGDLEPTIRSSGDVVLPNVFCGVVTVMLVILYFYVKSVPLKEKVASLLLIGVLVLSFDFNSLNYIWHGFHFPNDLPYRQSFVYVFFLLTLAFRTVTKLRELSRRDFLTVGLVTAGVVILAEKLEVPNFRDGTVLVNLCFIALYVVLFSLLNNREFRVRTVAYLLFLGMFAEVTVADIDNFDIDVTNESYTSEYDGMKAVDAFLEEYDGANDYRVETTYPLLCMNPSWYGYNGISMFSSMAYEHSSNLYYNTGIAGNFINSYTYRPQTPVFHSMFNLKYLVDNDPEVHLDSKYFSQIGELSGLTVYKNNYYLPIAYGVKDDIVNWDHATGNPFQVQNDFLRRAAGISEAVFTNVTLTDVSYNNVDPFTDVLNSGSYSFNKTSAGAEGSFTVSFAPEETGRYYVYCRTGNADTIYLSADDGYSAQTPVSTDNQYVFDLGTRTKDVTVRIEVPLNDDSGSVELFVVRQNDDVFEKAYRVLSKNVMEVTRFEDTLVEGTVTLDQGQMLYTSINYDEGWTIEIDGKPINYELAMSSGEVEKIGDALIGLHMGPGTHTLSFRYHAKGLRTGLLLSLLGVLLLLALTLLPGRVGRRRKSSSGHIENDNENVE
ncbi:MAG: YfhO family protein [Clostridia bacterium]|nr:YfhO family protein [Clostridia bacterium]